MNIIMVHIIIIIMPTMNVCNVYCNSCERTCRASVSFLFSQSFVSNNRIIKIKIIIIIIIIKLFLISSI